MILSRLLLSRCRNVVGVGVVKIWSFFLLFQKKIFDDDDLDDTKKSFDDDDDDLDDAYENRDVRGIHVS